MEHSIYFPIYQKIEKEVIDLTSSIYFSDSQIGVYSLRIADLIIRCSIELESLVKDIFRLENGMEPESPGNAFVWLDKKWGLSQKALTIISPYVHFKKEFIPSFSPFDYKSKSPEDYFSTYNAIKHDRAKNIDKANIYTLIRVMGALYILNLYYRKESVYLEHDSYGTKMNKSLGSDFFAFFVAPLQDIVKLSSEKDIDPMTCVYKIVRQESNYGFRIIFIDEHEETKTWTMINISEPFQSFAKSLLGKQIDKDKFFDNIPFQGFTEEGLLKEMKAKNIVGIETVKPKTSYFAKI